MRKQPLTREKSRREILLERKMNLKQGKESNYTAPIKAKPKMKKKKRRSAVVPVFLGLCLLAILVIASVTVLFNIKQINVVMGENAVYTSEEIIAASQIKQGDNMYRIDKFKTTDRIKDQLPYIDTVEIKRNFPDGITISVTYTVTEAVLKTEEGYYNINKDSKVLEFSSDKPEGYIIIENAQIDEIKTGQVVDYKTDSVALSIKEILNAIKEYGYSESISAIDCGKIYDYILTYGIIDVHLGNTDNIDKKFELFKEVYNKISKEDPNALEIPAIIDVSDIKAGRYRHKT